MAYAYQGSLFNPAGAERRVKRALARSFEYVPFGQRLLPAASRVVNGLVSNLLFRGFKQ